MRSFDEGMSISVIVLQQVFDGVFLPFESIECRPPLREGIVIVDQAVLTGFIVLNGAELGIRPFLLLLLFLDDVDHSREAFLCP